MQNDTQGKKTRARTRRVRDFFYHLIVFLFVLALLVAVDAGGAVVWIGLLWGFAVAMHGVYAYFG
jgi:hypothetical protein